MQSFRVHTAPGNSASVSRLLPANNAVNGPSGLRLDPELDGIPGFSPRSQHDAAFDEGGSARRRSILLVEDNPADVMLLREAFIEHQVTCEVLVLTDGERAIDHIEAIDSWGADCPDIVILDLNLPKRPGSEVLERLRRSFRCGQAPVVILSSSDAPKDRNEAARLGATRYIRKPSRLDEFLQLGGIFKQMLTELAT